MMLYKTRSSQVLKTIMEDISDQITDEEFFDVYEKATSQGDHDFLFIDWHPKKHSFRRCFNEHLLVASDANLQNGDAKRKLSQGDRFKLPEPTFATTGKDVKRIKHRKA